MFSWMIVLMWINAFIHLDEVNGCMVQHMDEIYSSGMNPMGIGIEIFTSMSIRVSNRVHLSKGRIVEIMSMFNLKEARCGTHKHIEHVYNSLKEICFNALSLPCVSFLSMCMDLKTVLFYHLRICKFIS
jgi:hypothetical protein